MSTLLENYKPPPMDEEEPIEDIYVYIVREAPDEVIVEAEPPKVPVPSNRPAYILTAIGWLAILTLVAYGFLFLLPSTTTITIVSRDTTVSTNATIVLPAHLFPLIQREESATVPTTGHGHQDATVARGTLTFYNAATYPQTIGAGVSVSGSSGIGVMTDAAVTIPAGNLATNGRASISAHAIATGPQGNIPAGDIFGPCCRSLLQVVNAAFTGGQNARDYQAVAPADIDGTTGTLANRVNASIVLPTVPPSETLVTPLPCTTHSMSSEIVGAEAKTVMVTVQETCHPASYRTGAFQEQASAALALQAPGGMTRLGELTVRDTRATLVSQTVTLSARLSGVFGYPYDSQALARLLGGKSQQEATPLLLGQPGVSRVQITGSLPKQADHLRIVVLYQEVQP